jgi:DNA polymerase elongation subunit (family B)
MDPIRFRVGEIGRDILDDIMNEPRFVEALNTALMDRSSDAVLSVLDKYLKRRFPLAGDPVIQIGVVLEKGQGRLDKHIFVLDSCDRIIGIRVHTYKTEKELILGWAKTMREWNPDVLLGYNNFGFDERYVWLRAEELGISKDDSLQALTRLQSTGKELVLQEKFLSSSALGDNTMYMLTTHGRLGIDLYHYIKRNFSLSSYKLDDVCQHFMSGSLKTVDCGPEVWNLNTKTTSDVIPGRWVVLLDETGDAVVEKLRVKEVVKGQMLVVAAPEDGAELSIAAQLAVKWAVVKDDVSPHEIFRFHRGSSADRAKVAAYCIQDCVLVRDLYKKLDVFNNAMAMANACSVPIPYIFTRGQGIKIESLIFKECYERGQCVKVLPTTAFGSVATAADESYEGAIVLDPVVGIHYDSPIGVADFASLYPSTIISENISYDTLVWVKDYSLDGSFKGFALGSEEDEAIAGPDVRWTDITFDIWGTDPNDLRKHPAKLKQGMRVCRYAQGQKGTLPQIVQKLLATRKAKRKEAEKESDPFKKALLDAEQLAYKLTANSLYGQLGSGTFKIRLQHLAASVTAYGRKQILFAKAAIENFYGPAAGDPRCSAETIYGDTDSLFIKFNAKNLETGQLLEGRPAIEATMHLTEEAGKFVTRCLKAPHDFEYDKVFYPFIIFSKKRYVGNKYEGSSDSYYQNSMGIATKRRDYAPLVKLIYGGALRILLTERNIQSAIGFVKEKLTELVEGKMSMNLLTMSKSLRAEYKAVTPPAHKALAERMKLRDEGTAPASGERVPFIYILPPIGQVASKSQGDRVEHPNYIREKGLKPDFRYYIEHQLMNPIVQLFSLVVEKIPGIRVPTGGWTEASRDAATTDAIFYEALSACDKSAVRRFGSQFFGAVAVPVGPRESAIRLPVRKDRAKSPAKKQSTLNTYFADKMLIKTLEASKKKKSSKDSP